MTALTAAMTPLSEEVRRNEIEKSVMESQIKSILESKESDTEDQKRKDVMKFKYFKKWKGSPAKLEAEGEPVGWFEVTKEDMVEVMEGAYRNVEDVIKETLHAGHEVNTPFSIFKAECAHKRQSASSGGWVCLDCGSMWNSKGKKIK